MRISLSHLAITTKDMEKSLDFYGRVLGFQKEFEIARPETGEPWIVYLSMGNDQFIELFYGGEQDNVWNAALRGFNHMCLSVDDIHAFAEMVQKAGYPIDKMPKQGADGNWQLWVTDPDGVRLEIMQIDPESPQGKIMARNAAK